MYVIYQKSEEQIEIVCILLCPWLLYMYVWLCSDESEPKKNHSVWICLQTVYSPPPVIKNVLPCRACDGDDSVGNG